MDNLAKIANSVTEFAATVAMTLVPAVPVRNYGHEVYLGPDIVDLPAFLALAQKVGGGVLYLKAAPFNPERDEDQPDDPPAHLTKHTGEIGEVSVAFAVNGLVHYWEQQTTWFQEWEDLTNADSPGSSAWRGGIHTDDPDRLSPQEQGRLSDELAAALLADPQVRAAKGGSRQRQAQLAVPPDTDRSVMWEAVRKACDQADEMARATYARLTDQLDELAAELTTTPQFQTSSSAGARKQAAEQFLIPRADGFCPPAVVRDELYARAQKLARAGGRNTTGLF